MSYHIIITQYRKRFIKNRKCQCCDLSLGQGLHYIQQQEMLMLPTKRETLNSSVWFIKYGEIFLNYRIVTGSRNWSRNTVIWYDVYIIASIFTANNESLFRLIKKKE